MQHPQIHITYRVEARKGNTGKTRELRVTFDISRTQHVQEQTKVYIKLNCQRVALHGCHLTTCRLPVTPSSRHLNTIDLVLESQMMGHPILPA